MGLNIVIYNLRWPARVQDNRFDSFRHAEDYAFVGWLNSGHAVYRHFGNPHRFDSFIDQSGMLGTEEEITRLKAGGVVDTNWRELDPSAEIFERPKDFAAARMWVQEHFQWDNAKKRLLDLLDLLEADDNLWIYESW